MKETTMSETLRPSGRHPVSIGHLVMGLAFLGLVGVWGLVQADVVGGDDIRWLLPVPWVLAGLAGLLATTLSNRGRWATRQTGWVEPQPDLQPGTVRVTTPETTPETTPDTTTDNPIDTTEENR
jgi:hypothetical protein